MYISERERRMGSEERESLRETLRGRMCVCDREPERGVGGSERPRCGGGEEVRRGGRGIVYPV